MAVWRRAALPASVGVLLVVSAWVDWWSAADDRFLFDSTLRASLVGARLCSGTRCMDVPSPDTWQLIGWLVALIVAATAFAFLAAAFLIAARRTADAVLGLAGRASIAVLGAAGVALADATLQFGGSPGWGGLLAIAGGVLGLVARASAAVADDFGAARSSVPIAVTPAGAAGAIAVGTRPKVERDPDRHPTPSTIPPRYTPPTHFPTHVMADVRFVARSGAIGADRVTAVLATGTTRVLAWRELARVAVHRLPPDPPFEKAAFLDLIPHHGAPVRLLATSLLDYSSLPDGAAPSTKENWRRLVAFARAANPKIVVEPDSAPFFAGGDAPMFPAIKLFDLYDRRYG